MSEITNWYARKNVLITGATGFVGKVLVERILSECDEVNSIYLIVRGKKNFVSRCEELLNHTVFDHLRKFKPGQIKKIKIVEGDLAQENAGLNQDNLFEIITNIDIVIHSGADVRFDLTLCDSLTTNTIGTYRLLRLAKGMKKLKVFVFVSTTYSQSHQQVTEERHYDAEVNVFALIKAYDRFDDQTMKALQPKILKEFPNSYSFSKHLSEDIVYRYRNELPICIVRPSIVGAAVQHPMPDFTEGVNSLNGWAFASLRGVLRTVYCNPSAQHQVIPVDIVANTLIATSWIHGSGKLNTTEYYNANISETTSLAEVINISKLTRFEYPLNYSIWIPNAKLTSCVYYYYIRTLFFQILPSLLLNLLMWMLRHKPIMLKIQRKIYYGLRLVQPYLQTMTFETTKFRNIRTFLNETDNEIFNTKTDHVTPQLLARINARGIRKFLAKEKDEDLPRARRNILIWYWVHVAVQCLLAFCLIQFVFGHFCKST